MNELNEKLAKWAGFEPHDHEDTTSCPPYRWRVWHWPDGGKDIDVPDFCNDLNACFKWLVPKLERVEINYSPAARGWPTFLIVRVATLEQSQGHRAKDGDVALALCKAIEKVLDA